MNGERNLFQRVGEFDPLPLAYASGVSAMAMGLFSDSGIVGLLGLFTVVGSKIVQETDFENPQDPRKKKDDK